MTPSIRIVGRKGKVSNKKREDRPMVGVYKHSEAERIIMQTWTIIISVIQPREGSAMGSTTD